MVETFKQFDRSPNENKKFVEMAGGKSGIVIGSAVELLKTDDTGTLTYVGNAVTGTATSAAAWKIKEITNASGDIVWADGDGLYNNVWDNRASLTYT